MSPEEAVKEIEKDKPFYQNSGGGVTFSGGEPLVQWQFLLAVSKMCKERDISTALETTGCAKWEVMEKVLKYIDLVLYDIKHLDPLKHIEGTGVSNELILDNFLKTAHTVRTWLRVPIIPNFNDSTAWLSKLGEFVKGSGVEKVSLLPYHTWGEHKYERLGTEYPLKGIESLSPESLDGLKKVMESYGLTATIGS
jgi:pyruvate formate lyase activating enzyme